MESYFLHKDLIYSIYEEKSFSRAARKNFVSQPFLSVLVKKTERQIGMPLFDRSSKPLRLTDAGREYMRAVEEIRRTEQSFASFLDAENGLATGTLSIGANQLLSALVLPEITARFIKKYPHVSLSLTNATSSILEQGVLTGAIDLIIDSHQPDPHLFDSETLAREYLLLAVPVSFAITRKTERLAMSQQDILAGRHKLPDAPCAPLSAFSEVPFLMMTKDNDIRQHTDQIFEQEAFQPHVILEVDRLVTLYKYIEIGTAASIVSDTLIRHLSTDPKPVCFYKLNNEYAVRSILLSRKHNRYCSRAARAFLEIMNQDSSFF